jgi:hypothetical protein
VEDLIKALKIFATYGNPRYPTHCEHDCLHIMGVTKDEMSGEHIAAVELLGFLWSDSDEAWISFRFGSA